MTKYDIYNGLLSGRSKGKDAFENKAIRVQSIMLTLVT